MGGVGKYYPIRYNANGTVAEEQERIDNNGQHPFKVVNGWPADKGEWPWIAALLNNGRQFCGGSLITQEHILTAAHCVAHMSRYDVANLKVRLGDHEIRTVGETEIFESKAARVVRHKEFSQQTLHKDVAIISLETPVPESMANVRAVCLPHGHQTYAGQTAKILMETQHLEESWITCCVQDRKEKIHAVVILVVPCKLALAVHGLKLVLLVGG